MVLFCLHHPIAQTDSSGERESWMDGQLPIPLPSGALCAHTACTARGVIDLTPPTSLGKWAQRDVWRLLGTQKKGWDYQCQRVGGAALLFSGLCAEDPSSLYL